jgi:hypothetical protein
MEDPLASANDPSMSPERLRQLLQSDNSGIVEAVMRNPNIATADLFAQAHLAPRAFLANPVLPLLILEDPTCFRKLSEKALLALLRYAELPDGIIQEGLRRCHLVAQHHAQVAGEAGEEWESLALAAIGEATLYGYRHTTEYLGSYPALSAPDWLIEALVRHRSLAVREGMATCGNMPVACLRQLAADTQPTVRLFLAIRPDLPPDLLMPLVMENFVSIRQAAGRNPNLPAEFLAQLAQHPDGTLRGIAAAHQNTPRQALESLAGDGDDLIRWFVASNPQTHPKDLTILARDGCADIRVAIANNSGTPSALLAALAHDAAPEVREAVASHVNAPPEILVELARDSDVAVRLRVACHPRLPPEALALLEQDDDGGVFQQAQHFPRTIQERAGRIWVSISKEMAEDDLRTFASDVETLKGIAVHAEKPVREYIATRAHTPSEVLALLTQDADEEIVIKAAGNPSLSTESLIALLRHPHPQVREAAMLNPRALTLAADQLQGDPPLDPMLIARAQQRRTVIPLIRSQQQPLGRLLALSAPCLTAEELSQEAETDQWVERFVVARHPSTAGDTLVLLAEDGNRFVRAAARAALALSSLAQP